MARGQSDTLTEREAQIMDVVWDLGEATAEQVREALPGRPHDSTVRTLLRVLVSKGYLTQSARGKAYAYAAAIGRDRAQKTALHSVLARFFGGSAEDLVLRLIEDRQITPEQIEELRRKAPDTVSKAPKQNATRTRSPKKGS